MIDPCQNTLHLLSIFIIIRFVAWGHASGHILLRTRTKAKITKINFHFDGNDEAVAMAIMNIQDAIEEHINPPTKPNWYKA